MLRAGVRAALGHKAHNDEVLLAWHERVVRKSCHALSPGAAPTLPMLAELLHHCRVHEVREAVFMTDMPHMQGLLSELHITSHISNSDIAAALLWSARVLPEERKLELWDIYPHFNRTRSARISAADHSARVSWRDTRDADDRSGAAVFRF